MRTAPQAYDTIMISPMDNTVNRKERFVLLG